MARARTSPKKGQSRRGGARPGAGRPKDPNAGAPHVARPKVAAGDVVHAWWTTRPHIPTLTSRDVAKAIKEALEAGQERLECRIVVYRLQKDRLDVLCEADRADHLSRCLQGLGIRVAKAINRLQGTRGKVFAERFRQEVLEKRQVTSTGRELLKGTCGKLAVAKHRGLRGLTK